MAARSPLRLVFLTALALPLLPAAALAASAVTSQGVTMRSGPADTYGPVAELKRGDHVDVRQCDGNFCQILFDGKTGWVSADYLTRGAVSPGAPKPPVVAATPKPSAPTLPPASAVPKPPQVATTAPKTSEPTPAVETPKVATAAPKTIVPPAPKPAAEPKVADLPPVAPAAAPSPKPAAPKIASAAEPPKMPKPRPRPVLPLPPAYAETAPAAAAPRAAEAEVVPLPGPRPKVDIPGGQWRDYASADVPPPPRDIGDDGADWGQRGEVIGPVGFGDWPRHPRRDIAAFEAGGAHVCFVDPAGGSGFCVREGDRIVAPRRWAQHALELRNPGRLNVVVCDIGGDCHTYQSSSRLVLGGRSIAEITVAAPGY
jgi:hypothetical protein